MVGGPRFQAKLAAVDRSSVVGRIRTYSKLLDPLGLGLAARINTAAIQQSRGLQDLYAYSASMIQQKRFNCMSDITHTDGRELNLTSLY